VISLSFQILGKGTNLHLKTKSASVSAGFQPPDPGLCP